MPDLDCLMNEPWTSKIFRQIIRKVFDEISYLACANNTPE